MITIQEAKSKKEITEFIKFPFSLYKDNKYWVPPLIADELETEFRNVIIEANSLQEACEIADKKYSNIGIDYNMKLVYKNGKFLK